MGYEDNGKQSLFNAGVAQAERIDSLQRAINMGRFNPQQFNPETNTFNYEIMISSLNGLFMESWSKADVEEREFINKINKLIDFTLTNFPPVDVSTRRDRQGFTWNNSNYKKLLTLIQLYEKSIKDILDNHSLNSPNRDDDDEGL